MSKTKKVKLSNKSTIGREKIIGKNIETNIGIYDITGENNNPLTGEPYQNLYKNEIFSFQGEKLPATYANYARSWSQLPVYAYRDEITKSIQDNQITLVRAGTGVGKTVIIPKLALHAFNYKEKVITTIPKRLIAKSTAERDAKWLDTKIGQHVGYYFKGTNLTSSMTKLLFTTTGSLLSRMTGDDPYLRDYKVIIIDEAHERSVQTDQVLLLVKHALEHRPDLRLVIMSATIDSLIFKNFFKGMGFNQIDVPGISFPITHYWIYNKYNNWHDLALEYIMKILKTTTYGDILVFGKSGADAGKICSALAGLINAWNKTHPDTKYNPFCVKLASNSSSEEEYLATDQYAYLELESTQWDKYNRKVVVSTNVAESSLTVNGIVYVIDSGLEYTDSYLPGSMVRSLFEEPATQASITQRAGRAGRVAPGFCYHLYTEQDFNSRPKYAQPSIQKSDITSDILDLLKLEYIKSGADLKKLLAQFISPPDETLTNSSLRILDALGAIDKSGAITPHGKYISQFRGIKPVLASAIIKSWHLHCWKSVIDIVASSTILDGQFENIFVDPDSNKKKDRSYMARYHNTTHSYFHPLGDYFTLLNIVRAYNSKLAELKVAEMPEDSSTGLELLEGLAEDGIIQAGGGKLDLHKCQSGGGGGIDAWCKSQFISAKRMRLIKQLSRDLTRILKKLDISRNAADIAKYKKYNDLTENDRIICALCLDNPCNIALRNNRQKYTPIFPNNPVDCMPAPDSSISGGNRVKAIVYYELFSTIKKANVVKANVVSIIPEKLIALLDLKPNKHNISTKKQSTKKQRPHHRKRRTKRRG